MLNKTHFSLVTAAVLIVGPALNAAAQTVTLGRATIAAPSMVMGLNSPVQSATPNLTPMVMPSLLVPTIIPAAPARVVSRVDTTPTAQLTDIPQGLNLNNAGAVQKLSASLDSMYTGSNAPDGRSSGNVWTTDMLQSFVNEHGATLLGVPGVLDVLVGHSKSLGGKLPSLTIIVESTLDLAKVMKAVEKAVPDIQRIYGIMGAPNQMVYWSVGKGEAVSPVSASRSSLDSMNTGSNAPDGGSSGNVWTTDMLNAFVNEHGTALRAVPGVLNVVVTQLPLSVKRSVLTITFDSSMDLATVKKAVEKAVPSIERLNGLMGAPKHVVYRRAGDL